jgi:hypothetical protein
MYLNEITQKKFRVGKYNIVKNSASSISLIEQECNITILNVGIDDETKHEIYVDCTFQNTISKLCKSEFFELREILVSTYPRTKDFVLGIKGKLDYNGLTIRHMKPVFNESERQVRAERLRNIRLKSKTTLLS